MVGRTAAQDLHEGKTLHCMQTLDSLSQICPHAPYGG